MAVDPSVVGKAIAGRVADLEAAMARHDSFAYRPDALPPDERSAPLTDDEVRGTALDLLLGALRVAAEPVGYALMQRLAEGDATTDALAAVVGLSRLATWERLNALVQAGFVGRAYDADSAGLTPAGAALVELVEGAVAAAVAQRGTS